MPPAARREQILRHAVRLFESRSPEHVTLGDVATAAGVARPLVHYYFGTKRDLYLEVLQHLAYVPLAALEAISADTMEGRIDAGLSRWLSVAERHRDMWLTYFTRPTPSGDPEIDLILRQADEVAAGRMVQVLQMESTPILRSLIISFGGMARAACREWLVDGSLERDQVHLLLRTGLISIVVDVLPHIETTARVPAEA